MIKDDIAVSKAKEKVNFLNENFHSVFYQIITELDITKSRGPDRLTPIFFP